MAWNIDTEQSTKNILLNFKLPGTRVGQQSYAKIHMGCEHVGLRK